MAFAKCGASRDVSVSGTLEVSQLATWEGASGIIGAPPLSPPPYVWDYITPVWVGSIVGPGGTAGLMWVVVENIVVGPPYVETAKLYVRETAGGNTNDVLVSTGTANWTPAPTLEWDISWATSASHNSAHTQDQVNLFPFKDRYGNEQDDVATVPNECHPTQFSMVYTWGSDDYDKLITLGGASDSDEGLTLTPSVDVDGDGRPIAMTGTQDLTGVGIAVGLTTTPKTGVTGTVVRWTNLQWSVGGFLGEAIDLSAYSFTGSGITVTVMNTVGVRGRGAVGVVSLLRLVASIFRGMRRSDVAALHVATTGLHLLGRLTACAARLSGTPLIAQPATAPWRWTSCSFPR